MQAALQRTVGNLVVRTRPPLPQHVAFRVAPILRRSLASAHSADTQLDPLVLLSTPKISARLDTIAEKVATLQSALNEERDSQRMGVLAKELSDLEPVAQEYATFKSIMTSLNELGPLLADPDMRALAQEEQTTLLTDLTTSADAILTALLPRDIADEGSAVLELRAGAGGSEAALFVRDLFGMYEQYALLEGWQFKPAHCTLAEAGGGGGFKDATAIVSGKGVFARFKFESGTHRVQRVPETEAQGRIHTSTVTVAVLPMPEQVEKLVDIPEKDLRIDVFRASGAGGQHVNTTESAVRLTHLPTGIVVSNQDERSQHKNKAKAMSVMRAKLYDLERSRVQTARRDARRALIGTGDRSERIRTYNFPQGRVTDHRVGVTVHDLHGVLKGIKLGEILDELNVRARLEGLSEVAGE